MTKRRALTLCLASLLLGRRARADEPLTADAVLPIGLRIDLSAGVAVLSTLRGSPNPGNGTSEENAGSGGMAIGCAVGGRAGAFAGGVHVDAVTTVFDQQELYGGAHGGYVTTHGRTEWSVLPDLERQTVVARTTELFGEMQSISYDVGGVASGLMFRTQFGD